MHKKNESKLSNDQVEKSQHAIIVFRYRILNAMRKSINTLMLYLVASNTKSQRLGIIVLKDSRLLEMGLVGNSRRLCG